MQVGEGLRSLGLVPVLGSQEMRVDCSYGVRLNLKSCLLIWHDNPIPPLGQNRKHYACMLACSYACMLVCFRRTQFLDSQISSLLYRVQGGSPPVWRGRNLLFYPPWRAAALHHGGGGGGESRKMHPSAPLRLLTRALYSGAEEDRSP